MAHDPHGLGLDVCVRTLRHSFASFAVNAGVPLASIGAALGHSSVQATARYAHVRPEAALACAAAVAAQLGGTA